LRSQKIPSSSPILFHHHKRTNNNNNNNNNYNNNNKMKQIRINQSPPPVGGETLLSSSSSSATDDATTRRPKQRNNGLPFSQFLSNDADAKTTTLPKSCLRRTLSDNNNLFVNYNEDSINNTDAVVTAASAEMVMIPSKSFTSSSSSSFLPSKPPPKNVSFHKIEIAEHEYELGDNPSCNGGCPLQLGWEPIQRIALDVEEYEDLRSSSSNLKRNREQLRIPPTVRDQLAKQAGATRAEVQQATQQARLISKSRIRSIKARAWDNIHYRLELTSRALKKVTSVDGIKLLTKSSRQWSSSVDLRGQGQVGVGGKDSTTTTTTNADEPQQISDHERVQVPTGIPKLPCEKKVVEEDNQEEIEEPLSF
jgi:hypothetical protein